MGNCFGVQGVQVKAESPFHSGANDVSTNSAKKSSMDPPKPISTEDSVGNAKDEDTSTKQCSLRAFSYNDLRTATRNFRPDSILGEGGFGCVFKGFIDENTYLPTRPGQGIIVAVKKLNLDGIQGHKEWLAEVNYLGELHHPNVVRLIGHCAEDDHRLLVYEFMQRGSLENHLFRRNHNQTLSWAVRMKIAVGAARGLAFLHDAPRSVIFRDFKASNILLDSQHNAKLSDFGLAKDGPTGDNTHVSTRVMGTYGYAAPEYVATGHLTPKSDVYSFGVVLLEIVTGRKAVDKNRPGGEQNLVEWAKPYLNGGRKVVRIVDQKLGGQYSLKGAQIACSVANHCLCPDAKLRPTMKQVLESLEPLLNIKDLMKIQDGFEDGESSSPNGVMRHLNGYSSQPSPKQRNPDIWQPSRS